MSKPTELPRWANVGGAIVVPTSGKQDVGNVAAERPPAQYLNWLFNRNYQWASYLNDGVFEGAFALASDITNSPAISGTQNDYNPTGWGSGSTGAQVIRADLSGPTTLTGLAGGSDGRIAIVATFAGLGTDAALTFRHDDGAASTAANRFSLPEGQDVAIRPGGAALFRYDATSSRWRMVAVSGQKEILIEPGSLGGSQNNWAPTGIGSAHIIKIASGGVVNITGIAGGRLYDGRRILLIKAAPNTIILTHDDGASSAGNRFLCPGNANFNLTQNGAVEIMYDINDAHWRVLAI